MRLIASLCFLLALTAAAQAQKPETETISSSASAVRFYISNNGIFALNPVSTMGSFFYPATSGASYLFGGGLWFGAEKMVAGSPKKLVFITYNPNSGESWAYPGERNVPELAATGADSNVDRQVYSSTQYNRSTGAYLGVDTGRYAWPLWLTPVSGESAVPLRTGTFDPYIQQRGTLHGGSGGDHQGPAFVGAVDEEIVTRFHDNALDHYEIVDGAELAGYPIGLQVEENVYAWQEGRFANVVLVQYHIRNISGDTLRNCVVGQVSDPDIGISDNDHVDFYIARPELRTGYFWSEPDSSGTFGTLLMSLVEAPTIDGQGFVNNSARNSFKVTGRVGSFPYWTPELEDPKTSADRYNFMASNTFASDLQPDDQRAMLASQVFSMLPGDTAHFAVMYAVLDSTPPHSSVRRKGENSIASAGLQWRDLEDLVTSVTNAYYAPFGFQNQSQSIIDEAPRASMHAPSVVPNPAEDAATLRFTLARQSRVKARLVNCIGQTVSERELGMLQAGSHLEQFDLIGLPAGFYMAVIETASGIEAIPMTIRR